MRRSGKNKRQEYPEERLNDCRRLRAGKLLCASGAKLCYLGDE